MRKWQGIFVAMALVVCALAPTADAATAPTSPVGPGLISLRSKSARPPVVLMQGGFARTLIADVKVPAANPVAQAQSFLGSYASMFGLDSNSKLGILRTEPGPLGSTAVVFYQTQRGIPVAGAELSVVTFQDRVLGAVGRLSPRVNVDTLPRIKPRSAISISRGAALARGAKPLAQPKLVIYDPGITRGGPTAPKLAWSTSVGRERVTTDALTGAVLDTESLIEESYDLNLLDSSGFGGYAGCPPKSALTVIGSESGLNAKGKQLGLDKKPDVNEAPGLMKLTYDFYKNTFNRLSYDGLDSQIQLLMRSNDTSNAYWDPSCDVIAAAPGYPSKDTFSHELTHGVDQFGANLTYSYQSGALNESYSDTLAAVRDNNWEHTPRPGQIRSLSDPPSFNQPDKLSSSLYKTSSGDHGGVHTNSGVSNKAHFLIADGQTFNNLTVKGVGRARLGQIAYGALMSLGASADFKAAAGMEMLFALLGDLQTGKLAGFCATATAWSAVEVLNQGDSDCDGKLDGSDADKDGDGIANSNDNCPLVKNANLSDVDADGLGDVCDTDIDGDGRLNGQDNCQFKPNADQKDVNKDGIGDVCQDADSDGVPDPVDNCEGLANPSQSDADKDGTGDACEVDNDNDGVIDDNDKCQFVKGGGKDSDGDGLGDVCDPCPNGKDVVIAYSSPPKGVPGAKPKPILQDSDNDGKPDGCESKGRVGSLKVAFPVGRKKQKLGRGLFGLAGGSKKIVVRAPRGKSADIPVNPCPGRKCLLLNRQPSGVTVRLTGLGRLLAQIVDSSGQSVGGVQSFGAKSLVLQFRPRGGERYSLHLQAPSNRSAKSSVGIKVSTGLRLLGR